MNNTSIYTWIESHRYLKDKEPKLYEIIRNDYENGFLESEKTGETIQSIENRGAETKFKRKMKLHSSWTADKQCTQGLDKVFHKLVKEIDKTVYDNNFSYYSFDETGNNEDNECDAGYEWGYHVSMNALKDAYDCLYSIYPGNIKKPDYVSQHSSIRKLYKQLKDKYNGDRKTSSKQIRFSNEYTDIVEHLHKDYSSNKNTDDTEEKSERNNFQPVYSKQFFEKFIFPEFNINSFRNICAFIYNEQDALTICNILKHYKKDIILLCSSETLAEKTSDILKPSQMMLNTCNNVSVEYISEEFLETYKGSVELYIHIHPSKSTYMHSDYFRIIDILLNHTKGKAVVCRTLGVFNRKYPARRENTNKVNREAFRYLSGILYKFINFNPGKHFFPKNDQPNLYCTMYIDYTKIHNDIEFDNFGEKNIVHSINDCNMFGYHNELIQIFELLKNYENKVKNYIYKDEKDIPFDYTGIKLSKKITTCYNHPKFLENEYYFRYNPEIYSEFYRGMYSDDMPEGTDDFHIYLSPKQAEFYRHNVTNCDIYPLIGILCSFHMTIEDPIRYAPMLCDKAYTTQSAYEKLGFTPELIVAAKNIIRRFSRYSAWFRAYNGIEDSVNVNDSSVPLF